MDKRISFWAIFLVFFLCPLFAYSQDTILIKNGKIVPVVGRTIPNGCLLIEKGKIAKIGTDISASPEAKVIDAKGMSVYPGLVATMTAIGVTGYPGAGDDLDELSVSTAQMDPYDALNPEDDSIEVTRVGGVTTVLTISGTRNVIDGKSLIMNLEGDLPKDMVIKRYAAQIFNAGARTKDKYPTTRPGVASLIRDKLNDAKRYLEMKKKFMEKGETKGEENKEESFKTDLEMEALLPVLSREVPALFIAHDEVTIRNALSLIKEYNLKGILFATADILKFVDQLAEEKIPVIWAGTSTIPKQWEPYDLNYHTASRLAAKGILFAFEQYGWGPNSRNVRNLPVPASLSVAHGLSEEEAIKALTISPARILGVDDQVGSLEVGKTANIVIWTESPIQMKSRVHTVIINGKIIPLESVQTRLRDKFEKIVRERQKKAEDRPEVISLLGKNLYATPAEGDALLKLQNELEEAKKNLAADPHNPELIILYGRRLAYLWRYHEAIVVYTKGIEEYPDYAMLYRHRGHRYISIREFDKAISDLEKAAELNNKNFEIWYHLGLAYYLKGNFEKALYPYQECLKCAEDDDSKIAISNWLYIALHRLGKKDKADEILQGITEGMKVVENQAYYNLLFFYKGIKKEEEFSRLAEASDLDMSTIGYGIGCWHLYNGDEQKAKNYFEKIVEGKYWPAFGFIAAEAELAHSRK